MIESLSSEKAKAALDKAVIKTFEEMAFLDVCESSDKESAAYENILSLDILKPVSGKILLFLPEILKSKIMENIYSMENSALGLKEKDDCLLELLNILSGNFLSIYYGKNAEYKMELPQINVDFQDNESKNYLSVSYNAEGMPFKVVIDSVRYWY